MSVLRTQNWLSQQRIDVPHLRSLDSSVCADFDLLAGLIIAGEGSYIVSGFEIIQSSATGAASSIEISVSGGAVIHPLATESGSIYSVPNSRSTEVLSSTNDRVSGSFTPSATNYIGIDLRRSADPDTVDLVRFITSSLVETSQSVPLGRTLDYLIVISTSEFSSTPTVCPIATVVTDAQNNVESYADARKLFFRLGSGGSVPDRFSSYSWPGDRSENLEGDVFSGGDKGISSLKESLDATMTRLWELGGGEYWYSPTADRNVKLLRSGTTFSNNEFLEWDGTDLHWRGLSFSFDNSTGSYNDIADQLTSDPGLTDLADGECIYVDIDRTTNRTGLTALVAVKSLIISLGTPETPGSRYIIAWRKGSSVFSRDTSFPVGYDFPTATTTTLGYTRISHNTAGTYIVTPMDDNSPVAMSEGGRDRVNGFVGLNSDGAAVIENANDISLTIESPNDVGLYVDGYDNWGIEAYGEDVAIWCQGNGTNSGGIEATAQGTGTGVWGAGGGGATSIGVHGDGNGAAGIGVLGEGSGTGVGVKGIGSSSAGVRGEGGGTGAGGSFLGGNTSGAGVDATGGNGGNGGTLTGALAGHGVVATGGATDGNGVVGQGTAAGAGGKFTGGTTGESLIVQTAASATKSSILIKDSAGNKIAVWDRMGHKMGRTCVIDSMWYDNGSNVAVPTHSMLKTVVSDVDMVVSPEPPTSTYPATMCWLTPSGAAGDDGDYAVVTSQDEFLHTGFTGMMFSMEWEACTTLSSTSDRDCNLTMGFQDDVEDLLSSNIDPFDFNDSSFIGFGLPNGGTNNGWTCYTVERDVATTSTPPASQVGGGVPTTTDIQKFRIEIWGSATPTGATTVRFFIDSAAATTTTLRATHTTNIPSDKLALIFGNQLTAVAATQSLKIGPVRMEWNRYLTAPAP